MRVRKKGVLISFVSVLITISIVFSTVALAQNGWDVKKTFDSLTDQTSTGKEVGDYTANHGDLTGEKIKLDEPKLEEKSWYEYIDYVYSYSSEKDNNGKPYEGGYTYKIYLPADLANNSIMAIRDYELNGVENNTSVGITFMDMLPIFEQIAVSNAGIGLAGGVKEAIYGGVSQAAIAATIWSTMGLNDNIIRDSKYYSSTSFMGIPGDSDWNGISNSGFYNASSLSVSMQKSSQYNVQKTNTVSSSYSISGQTNVEITAKVGFLFAESSVKTQLHGSISSGLNYGVNFQQGQSVNNSETVSRTFSARTDDEVKNVAWKLCEYIVEVPFYLEQYDSEGNFVTDAYVTYTYLSGVCRVFANGYIEHWNTGNLVTYSDFFEGFHTATEIINEAKSKSLLD